MGDKRKKVVQGVEVEQVRFGDKWYTPVDERVRIAHTVESKTIRAQEGYHVVSVQFVQIGERWAYHCMVEYPVGSGIVKPGSDFIDVKDPAGLAKAETSAIGRALGLHGIAAEEGIASADEMQRVKREPTPAAGLDPHAKAPGAEITKFKEQCLAAGVHWREMVVAIPAKLGGKTVDKLTNGDLTTLRRMLQDNPQQFMPAEEGA